MSHKKEIPFFIGWALLPPGLRWFMGGVGIGLIIVMAALGYTLAAEQPDPGEGRFAGRTQAEGVITREPYPLLHITAPANGRYEEGTSILLYEAGKRGAQNRTEGFDGARVNIRGARITRGELEGIQINRISASEGPTLLPAEIDLGRWRLSGEICDGKCYNGAMRPGEGLAHKTCANICLDNGIPPLLVTRGQIDGADVFLLGLEENKAPIPESILDRFTGLIVEAEGRVKRLGGMHLFLVDPESIQVSR